LVTAVAVTAVAQAAPVRVVQGSDGTLYLVQAGNSWTLVPDRISDSDLATLTSHGGKLTAYRPNSGLLLNPRPPRRRPPRLHLTY
jgi:hypothetical protein